ncbi:MAG: hypothetical protein PHE79_11265 [Eubacteriales bacterium]|nr:hypothetical protein [Eubacteriales bacterium]
MERYSLLIAAPPKLKGLGKEIEKIKKFQDRGIFIEVNECSDLKTLFDLINQGIEPDFFLLFESITENRSNLEKAHTELLESLKKIKFSRTSKIILILQIEKEEGLRQFVNELIKLDIQDFHFISDFNTDDVIRWMLIEKKELKDNLLYITTEIAAKGEKEVVIKEIPKYIEVPAEDKKKKRFGIFGKAKDNRSEPERPGLKIIGITGAERGAGATTLCVELAEYLTQFGRVAILEKTERDELVHMDLKGIDIYTSNLGHIEISRYDFLIIDFGVFFEIGKLSGLATIITDSNTVIETERKMNIEKSYCSKIICVCPAVPWKLYKTDFLINNIASAEDTENWILFFNGNTNSDEFKSSLFMRKVIIAYNNENYLEEIRESLKGEQRT